MSRLQSTATRPGILDARAGLLGGLLVLLLALSVLPPAGPAAHADEPGGAAAPAEAWSQITHDGFTRVIVSLEEHARPEGELGRTQARQQRDRIRTAQQAVADALPADGSQVGRAYRTIPAMALIVGEQGLRALETSAQVRSIDLDQRLELADDAEDESLSPLLEETTQTVGTPVLSDLGYRGAGQAVAILDTGVDTDHPAFGDRVVAEACFSLGADGDPSTGGDCPEGGSEQTGEGAGVPLPDDVAGFWHGTHVAGIAAGQAVDASDLDGSTDLHEGIAPEADILAVQVFYDNDGVAGAWASDIIAGLEWVGDQDGHEVAAANLSLGGGEFDEICSYDPFTEVVQSLASQQVAVVAASGNKGWQDAMGMPACLPDVISVGSTDLDGTVSDFSNTADFLDLLAPGRSVHAAYPDAQAVAADGTSMATPHVAGGLALLQEGTDWRLEVTEVLDALRETGEPVTDDRNGVEDPLVFPETRLDAAYDGLVSSDPPGTPVELTADASEDEVSLSWAPGDGGTVDGYVVERDGAELWSGEATSFVDGDVESEAEYEYRVTAQGPGGSSEPAIVTVAVPAPEDDTDSDEDSDADSDDDADADSDEDADSDSDDETETEPEPEPAPAAPVDLAADASGDEVSLSWAPGDGGTVDGYVVERDGAELWSGETTSFVDGDVESGASYEYRVTAHGPGGSSDPAVVSVTMPEPEPEPVTFSDVDEDGAHGEAIGRMAGAGIINGYDDGTFRPSRTLTRAQAASLLVRGLEIDVPVPTGRFSDVPVDYVHAATIEAAAAAGIVGGYDDGTFRPGEPLTRAQAASMIARAFELPDGGPHGFVDVGADHPHGANIARAAEAGAVGGYDDGTFRPSEHLNRAQAASILDRLLHG